MIREGSEGHEEEEATTTTTTNGVAFDGEPTAAASAVLVASAASNSRRNYHPGGHPEAVAVAAGDGVLPPPPPPPAEDLGREKARRADDDWAGEDVEGDDDDDDDDPEDYDSAPEGDTEAALSTSDDDNGDSEGGTEEGEVDPERVAVDDDGSDGGANPSCRSLKPASFQHEVRLLQENSQAGVVITLEFSHFGYFDDDFDDEYDEGANPAETLRRASSFAQFVEELGKGEFDLRGVTFSDVDWRGLHETDLNLLFGCVLPTHRTLKWIHFYDSRNVERRVPTNCLKLFASAIPRTSPLTLLQWSGENVDQGTAQAIADMIRRDPPHLARLDIRQSGLDSDGIKAICDALPHNTHLRHLQMRAEEVFADSLDGAVGRSSPLRSLDVYMVERLTPEGMAGLAARLKTNTTLEWLHLIHLADGWGEQLCSGPRIDEEEVFRSVRDVLASCNFTLRELHVPDRPQGRNLSNEAVLAQIFARNSRILRVLEKLEVSSPLSQAPAVGSMATTRLPPSQAYRVEPPGLWPLAMEVTSGVPTPLYRLLRHGAVKDVADHLQPRAMPGAKKRGRASLSAAPTAASKTSKVESAPYVVGVAASPAPGRGRPHSRLLVNILQFGLLARGRSRSYTGVG